MENNTDYEIDIDLREAFKYIKSKIWITILSGLIFAFIAGIVTTYMIQPIYTSTAKLFIVSKQPTLTSLEDLQFGTQFVQDYMVLVKTRPVVEQVIKNLELDMSYAEVLSMITLTNPTDTRVLSITANNQDPVLAKKIADEFAKESKCQIAKIMDVEEATIVEEGIIQPYPSSPNKKKYVVLAGLLGMVMATMIIILRYILDDTIKSAEDIERYLGLDTLGFIPMESRAFFGLKFHGIKRNKKEVRGDNHDKD